MSCLYEMHIVHVSSKLTKIKSALQLAMAVKIIFQVIGDSQGNYSYTNIIKHHVRHIRPKKASLPNSWRDKLTDIRIERGFH